MPTRREMENHLGVTRAQAEQEAHPVPVCPECGSDDVKDVGAEGEMGYDYILPHLECQKCGAAFCMEDAE